MLFFAGMVHQLEVTKDETVNEREAINFAILGVSPPVQPTTLWHLGNTDPAWRSPKCTRAKAWSINCPCDCQMCFLWNSVCLLTFTTDSHEIRTKFILISYEICTYKCPAQVS